MKIETVNRIQELAKTITDLAKREGDEMLIGYSILNKDADVDYFTEGCVSSEGLEYDNASKMVLGIAGFVSDHYGKDHCSCRCENCGRCEDYPQLSKSDQAK